MEVITQISLIYRVPFGETLDPNAAIVQTLAGFRRAIPAVRVRINDQTRETH